MTIAIQGDAWFAFDAPTGTVYTRDGRLKMSENGDVQTIDGPLDSAGKEKGPFDIIVVEGAVDELPQGLLSQLNPDGRLVAVVHHQGRPAVAHLFTRSGEGIASRAEFDVKLPPS